MAKLPPKPLNPVHEFFPVGADGQSPMNFTAFDQAKKMGLVGEDEDETKWKKGGVPYIDGDEPLNKNKTGVEVGEGSNNELEEVTLTGKKVPPGCGGNLVRNKEGLCVEPPKYHTLAGKVKHTGQH